MKQTVVLEPALPRGAAGWPWRPKVAALRVTLEVGEGGAVSVVGDNLEEVLRSFDERTGHAVLGAWEEGFARHVDLMSASEYAKLGGRREELAAFRGRFRAWVHEEARARLFQGVPTDVVAAYARQGRWPPAPRVVATNEPPSRELWGVLRRRRAP